jgi:hypothetical protein
MDTRRRSLIFSTDPGADRARVIAGALGEARLLYVVFA